MCNFFFFFFLPTALLNIDNFLISSIWAIDGILTGTTTLDQTGPGSNGIPHTMIHQNWSFTVRYSLESYPGHPFRESDPFTGKRFTELKAPSGKVKKKRNRRKEVIRNYFLLFYIIHWTKKLYSDIWTSRNSPTTTTTAPKQIYIYRHRKWTRRHEFKSWTRLIAFHIALIPLGKVWIQLFSLQLWVNSRADCFFSLGDATSLGEGKLWIQTC